MLCQVESLSNRVWRVTKVFSATASRLKAIRFPRTVVSGAVWTYHHFGLGLLLQPLNISRSAGRALTSQVIIAKLW